MYCDVSHSDGGWQRHSLEGSSDSWPCGFADRNFFYLRLRTGATDGKSCFCCSSGTQIKTLGYVSAGFGRWTVAENFLITVLQASWD
jgi:hypothetical protein